jgi:ATP-dependent DNA helicase PIF1
MSLSIDQQYAFAKFKQKQNIFVTGPGGTGKTRFIQHIVSYMKQIGTSYQVCALTGCAAVLLNCGAKTIHSWSGIKLGQGTPEQIIGRIFRNKTAVKSWKKIEVLVIDEVSMLSQKYFELLDLIGRTFRKNARPFGGIRVVFTGDFFQLPPIDDGADPASAAFCFESPKWPDIFPLKNCIELTTFFRQTDPKYIEILQQIRRGYIEAENVAILQTHISRDYDLATHGGCVPTKLFPKRAKVEAVNAVMFNQLDEDEYEYDSSSSVNNLTYLDTGKLISMEDKLNCAKMTKYDIENEINTLLANIQAPPTVSLKKGAVVMCTANINVEEGICNGSQGVIVDFVESPTRETATMLVPLVRFSNGRVMKMVPFHRQSEEFPCISVSQIPLCLAWALTIHKIQGATLQMATIDIGKDIFEYGQTYVALSRIKSLDGLYLSEFYPHRIKANPVVIAFYESFPKLSKETMLAYIQGFQGVAESEGRSQSAIFGRDEVSYENVSPSPYIKVIKI